MRIVRGAAEARQTLLRRVSMDEPDLPPAVRETVRRAFGAELDAAAVVDRILRDVREEGDAAVRRYNQQIDGVTYEGPLEVSRSEVKASYSQVDSSLVDALRLAAGRIRDYHALQMKHAARSFEENGLGQLVRPIERVGLYIPGNKVIYPSTLLMTALPARAAGVGELVMVTPAREDGSVAPVKLVAADIAGVDRIFRAGGVQGIAALAYGTDSVPRVDKICGPGNIFVTIAKQRLFGQVGIDGIFGPSETLVIADASADPRLVAVDMLAGAEHDELATAILLTNSEKLATEVSAIVDREVAAIPRADAARTSLDARGGAVILASIEEAVQLASDFAAEHLCLHVENPEHWLEQIRNAGCVFAGEHSVESVGDYTAGPSHVMPTGGSARFSSALGVHDFLKVTSLIRLDPQTVAEIGPAGAAIAYAEGLAGHARAIESRLPEDKR
ncbi:MAG TPA: histidinol dehydrogenase [Dehalococcoidia bacterium]